MKPKVKIELSKVTPSPDIGRCEVCGTELATRILDITGVHRHRFCEDCWDTFTSIVSYQRVCDTPPMDTKSLLPLISEGTVTKTNNILWGTRRELA